MEANPVATAADRLARLKAQVEEGTKAMGKSRPYWLESLHVCLICPYMSLYGCLKCRLICLPQVEEGTKAMGESREELMRLFMAAEQQKPALQSSVYTWLYMYVYMCA